MITISCPLTLPPMCYPSFFRFQVLWKSERPCQIDTVAVISKVPYAGVFLRILLPNAALKWLN